MANLSQIKQEILEIARRNDLQNICQSIESLEESIDINVVLLGEFSSGKTTLVNAILGRDLLPTGTLPVTKAIVEVEKGDSLRAFIQRSEEEELREIPLLEVSDYISGSKASSVERIVIKVPESKLVPHRFKIVDTPGISSLDEVSEKITLGILPFCDVALIVLDVNKGGLTASLMRFLQEKLITGVDPYRIFFLLNKADTITPEEVEKVAEEIRRTVSEILPDPIVIPLSALQALKGDYQGSGFVAFEKLFREKILQEKEAIFQERFSQALKDRASEMLKILEDKKSSLEGTLQQIQEKLKQVESRIEELYRKKREIDEVFESHLQNLKEIIKLEIPQIAKELTDETLKLEDEERLAEIFEKIVVPLEKRIYEEISLLEQELEERLRAIIDLSLDFTLSDRLSRETRIKGILEKVKSRLNFLEIIIDIIWMILPTPKRIPKRIPLPKRWPKRIPVPKRIPIPKGLDKIFKSKLFEILKKYDPVSIILRKVYGKKARQEVESVLHQVFEEILNSLFTELRKDFEKNVLRAEIFEPLEDYRQMLRQLEKEKLEKELDYQERLQQLNKDLVRIQALLSTVA